MCACCWHSVTVICRFGKHWPILLFQYEDELGFWLGVCIHVLGLKLLGRICTLNYPGFIAGSVRARSDHLMVVRWVLCGTAAWSQRWSNGSGGLPQLQSHRVEKDLLKLSKDYKERLEQQTFLCPAVKAFLTLIRCGIHCEYVRTFVSKCHFP